ncbi:SMC-Scp complex subunit ScpB [Gammaproteobacteria bacterium]|nr:SMC-Scp complex subunit ScpB [Gammaproteobacteria bacterium]
MNNLTSEKFQQIIEAALMVAGKPLTIHSIQKLFDENDKPDTSFIKNILNKINENYSSRGVKLQEVSSGYQFQAKPELSPWLRKLWEEKPPKYSRAFLETLALIAYRQPVTRAEIEEIRGVTASSHIVKTLVEREWIKIMGHRDIPGKPALYGTTKDFLDYFNLQSLKDLPTLNELKDLDLQESKLQVQLNLDQQNINIKTETETLEQQDENNDKLNTLEQMT